MANGDVHISKSRTGWEVKVEGTARARSTHDTQAQAWKAGREVARRAKAEAFLHGRDGKIRERNSYGRDPRRSKG